MPVGVRDKYGIPVGGNSAGWGVRYWAGIHYQLTWLETVASVALGGWPESKWAEAAATASAESSRNPFIYNTYKMGHFGLFQISRSAHADFFAPNGEGMGWVSPITNAQQAYKIYQSEGWGAWEGHTNGGYLAYLAQAKAAVAALKAKGTGEAVWRSVFRKDTNDKIFGALLAGATPGSTSGGGLLDGLGNAIVGGAEATAGGTVAAGDATVDTVGGMAQVVTGFWQALTTPALWMRIGYGALGVVLVGGGLFLIVRNTPAGQQAVKTVTKVATKGAVQ